MTERISLDEYRQQKRCLTLDDWADREVPIQDRLLGSVFTTTTRAMLSAETGIGKTHFAFAVGFAMAAGEDFCHWQGRRPARCLLVDGEMPTALVKERLADAERRIGVRPDSFFILCREDVPDMPPLDTEDGQVWLDRLIEQIGGVDFLILDNVMALTAGDLKDEDAWKPVVGWNRLLTKRRIGCLWINHTGHDTSRSYGTKTREWQLDTVIIGEKIAAGDADLAMKITFSKARQRTPDNREDFETCELRLIGDEWKSSAASRERSLPKGATVALQALHEAVEEMGQPVPSMSGVPNGVTGVQVETWRDYFYRRRPLVVNDKTDAAEENRAKEARKKQFQRSRDALQEADNIDCIADWCWLLT